MADENIGGVRKKNWSMSVQLDTLKNYPINVAGNGSRKLGTGHWVSKSGSPTGAGLRKERTTRLCREKEKMTVAKRVLSVNRKTEKGINEIYGVGISQFSIGGGGQNVPNTGASRREYVASDPMEKCHSPVDGNGSE